MLMLKRTKSSSNKKAIEKTKETTTKEIKKGLIIFPEEKEAGIKYYLIEPFAFVNLKWDTSQKEYLYELVEPELSDDEKKTHGKIVDGLLEILDFGLSSIKKRGEAIKYLEEQIKKILDEYEIKLTEQVYLKILYYVQRNFVGLNEIEPLMQDPNIEDISCDGIGIPIYVIHRRYGSIKTNIVQSLNSIQYPL